MDPVVRLATLLLALAALLLAAPSAASASVWAFPAERKTDSKLVQSAVNVANAHWDERGVSASCRTTVYVVDDGVLDTPTLIAAGRGTLGCHDGVAKVWLPESRIPTARSFRSTFQRWCGVVVHEIGHNRGLNHSDDGGVMAPAAGVIPWRCRLWAKHRGQPNTRTTVSGAIRGFREDEF
jgi:hypothetical protein